MLVCLCKVVSDRDIRRAVADGATSVKQVAKCTGAGTGCGACREAIQDEIDEHHRPRLPMIAAAALTT